VNDNLDMTKEDFH